MRMTLLILIGLFLSATTNTARADQYKWCAYMGGGNDGGMRNCYFVTLQQCEVYVSGVGGFCMPSPYIGERPASSWGQLQTQPQTRGRRQ
jgi:hypothetical protein